MKQIDIFGNETEIKIDFGEFKKRMTMKQSFRMRVGYIKGKTCGTCKYHHRFDYNGKYYHKCEKLGITHSTATDIRLKDVACKLYEEGTKDVKD